MESCCGRSTPPDINPPLAVSVILANLGDGAAATVVRVSLVVGLFFTYGFQMFPVLEVRHRTWQGCGYTMDGYWVSHSSETSCRADEHFLM